MFMSVAVQEGYRLFSLQMGGTGCRGDEERVPVAAVVGLERVKRVWGTWSEGDLDAKYGGCHYECSFDARSKMRATT
jgi:hypothetical protein